MRNTKRITGMTKIKSNSYIDVLGSIRNGAIVLLASAFLLVGCNKDNGSVVEPVTKTSLTASMEQQGGDTKTSLEQLTNNVLWTKDDKISVFWDDDLDTNQEFSLSGEGGFQSGVFTGNGGADATNCYVFYPYDGDTGMMVDEDLTAISFRLPPYQSYKAGGFDSGMNPMVAYGAKTSKLSFKNLCGLLVINLKRTEGVSTKISQITVRSDNQKLSGEAYVQIPYTENESGVAVPKIVMGEDAFNSVSLFVNDAVDLINGDATFYIVVPPIAVSDVNKLTVEVISGGREYAKSTNNNLASVSRSKIRSMQALPLSSLTVTKYEEVSGVSLGEAIAVKVDFPGGWQSDAKSAFTAEGRSKEQNELFNHVRTLLNWRKTSKAICEGKLKHFCPESNSNAYIYFREAKGATTPNKNLVMVAINNSSAPYSINWNIYKEVFGDKTPIGKDVLSGVSVPVGSPTTLPPMTSMVVEF